MGGKKKLSVTGMDREKELWADSFVERGGSGWARPRQLRATKTKPMCVAEWRDWLAFGDDGRLDVEESVKNVDRAKELLVRTIKDADR